MAKLLFLQLVILLATEIAYGDGIRISQSTEIVNQDLTENLEWQYRDQSIDEVNWDEGWTPLTAKKPPVLITSSFWLKFSITNASDRKIALVLLHQYPFTDAIAIYHQWSDRWNLIDQIGDTTTFEARKLPHRKPMTVLEVRPGFNDFLIEIQTRGSLRPLFSIWSIDKFYASFEKQSYLELGLLGALVALMLVNVFFFGFVREKIYFQYISFHGLATLLFVNNLGYLQSWLPNSDFKPILLNDGIIFIFFGNCYFSYLFSRSFLAVNQEETPWINKFYEIAIILSIVGAVLCVLPIDYEFKFEIFRIASVGITLQLFIGFVRLFQGYRIALFYIFSWTAILTGTALLNLSALGIFGDSVTMVKAPLIGGVIEALISSIYLGYRFRERSIKAIETEMKLTENLLAEEKKKVHSYQQIEKLVFPHQLLQIKKGQVLEQTMPTGSGEAQVICLDIIGSTKFKHDQKHILFQSVFGLCYQKLAEEYDGDELVSNGFLINEMGDGFVCSIGFPFQCPAKRSPSQLAVDLAHQFCLCLDEVSATYHLPEPLLCSIGIASGAIEANYSVSQVHRYELYGDAIVKAVRYENLRRLIFPTPSSHTLVIHEAIHQELTVKQAALFDNLQLKDNLMVRDDPEAVFVFFCQIPCQPSLSKAG